MSDEDNQLITELKASHVGGLRPFILADIPNICEGVILVFCGDGHRSPEAIRKMLTDLSHFGDNISLHKIADNGQPLLLHPTIINCRPGRRGTNIHDHFLESIQGAYDLGKGKTVILLGHWPCGLAEYCEIDFPTYLRALSETKCVVKNTINNDLIAKNLELPPDEQIPLRNITILAGLHAHRADGMKTYYLDRHATVGYLKQRR